MNIKKALSYMFEDKQLANKAGIGALVSIVPILNFAWTGYSIEVMRNVIKGEPLPLPGWENMGKKFMDGLILFLAGLIYALPVLLLVVLPLTIIAVSAAMASNSNGNVFNSIMAAGGVVLFCLVCVFILYALALSIAMPAIYLEYAKKGTFAACFDFKAILAQIKKNTGAFFTAWGVFLGISIGASLAAGIVSAVIGWIPVLGQLVAFVVSIAAGLYAQLVYSHHFGQYGTLETQVFTTAPLPPIPPVPPAAG
jgi:hypothetical protein